ncbi:hypothetical protein INR49_021517 [Caranx melampygus]|nr:hypothetical protein INR49_021517 [Caranx melampygus]
MKHHHISVEVQSYIRGAQSAAGCTHACELHRAALSGCAKLCLRKSQHYFAAVRAAPEHTLLQPAERTRTEGTFSRAETERRQRRHGDRAAPPQSRMAHNDKDPVPVERGTLSPGQLQSLLKMEPKTLGIHEVHFTGDIALFLIVVIQVTLSGSVLVHSGRRPTLFWVKVVLVLHLISAAFATAALGLMSKHLPYRQDSYHCEHCRRLELHAVQHCFRKCTGLIEQKCKLLIDGILGTLVIFLVLELLICITAMLFGLSVLAAGGSQQVAVVVTEPDSEQMEDISTPPTEPQVEPIEAVTSEP